jgi:tetratricopeptide (TPR) repeat protein
MSHATDDSDAASFHSSKSHAEDTSTVLPPSEEEELVTKSNNYKVSANKSFASSDYDAAITGYERALETVPSYLDYEVAVLKSNIAACFVKMEEWKKAIDAATEAIDGLEKVDPVPLPQTSGEGLNDKAPNDEERGGQETTEKVIEVDDEMERKLQVLDRCGHGLEDVRKIRVKALLRRAKARMELGGWAALQGADEGMNLLHLSTCLTEELTCVNRLQAS